MSELNADGKMQFDDTVSLIKSWVGEEEFDAFFSVFLGETATRLINELIAAVARGGDFVGNTQSYLTYCIFLLFNEEVGVADLITEVDGVFTLVYSEDDLEALCLSRVYDGSGSGMSLYKEYFIHKLTLNSYFGLDVDLMMYNTLDTVSGVYRGVIETISDEVEGDGESAFTIFKRFNTILGVDLDYDKAVSIRIDADDSLRVLGSDEMLWIRLNGTECMSDIHSSVLSYILNYGVYTEGEVPLGVQKNLTNDDIKYIIENRDSLRETLLYINELLTSRVITYTYEEINQNKKG